MHAFVPLTKIQENALIGSMLGDGHLCMGNSNINPRLSVSRAIKDINYLEYEMSIFNNFLAKRDLKKRSCSESECSFSTFASPTFLPYYNDWYSIKTKVVPADLKLNGQIIAHWIADDGHVSFNKLPYRFTVELSTHGFTRDEVEFLSCLLEDRYNEKFPTQRKKKIAEKTGKEKFYWIIRIYDSACRVMFQDIDCHFKMTRKRIWDKPESRFYENHPERQISTKETFQKRKDLVKSIVDAGESITLPSLAKMLGYVYDGKIEYGPIYNLIDPYLDSGKLVKESDKSNNNTITLKVMK